MLIVTRLSLWHWSLCWQGPADRVNLGMKRAGPCQFPGWKPEQVALHCHQCIAIGLDFASGRCRSVGSALPERWFSPVRCVGDPIDQSCPPSESVGSRRDGIRFRLISGSCQTAQTKSDQKYGDRPDYDRKVGMEWIPQGLW